MNRQTAQWFAESVQAIGTAPDGSDGELLDRMEVQRLRFEAALDNMAQGLCFFDGAHRLIVCNRRYAEIYDLSFDRVRPGMTLRQIVDMRYEVGTSPRMAREEYLTWRDGVGMLDVANDTEITLQNGRVVAIHYQPMPDGGWVATHDDVTERKRAEAEIARLARSDALTGLSNRAVFHERLHETARRVAAENGRSAILCIDLDHFKEVNDTFGHAAGDQLLQEVARRLGRETRDGDTVARNGGDEFTIILRDISGPEEAARVAGRIVAAVSGIYQVDGHQAVVGASVGVAMIGATDPLHLPESLLRCADLALYRAKREGRGIFRMFEPGMDRAAQDRRAVERDLADAIARGGLELHYQPQLDTGDRRITGVEALVRWRRETGELTPPTDFIPLAEQTGLIVALGEWVLRTACRDAKSWHALTLAVNVSAVQLRKPGFPDLVAQVLRDTGFEPSRLELEITETTLLQDTEASFAALQSIAALGVRIAMDDFGTGYSSLSYLRRFRFDKIKIDRCFISDLTQGGRARAVVQALVTLGRGFGMLTVAEGVETSEQAHALRAEGCDQLQGFLIGRPVAAVEFERLYRCSSDAAQPCVSPSSASTAKLASQCSPM